MAHPLSSFTGEDYMTQIQLNNLTERISLLEKHVFKRARTNITTRSQQMLVLSYLGFFKNDLFKNMSNKKKSKLLSVLLNASSDNIEGDLSNINTKKSPLRTIQNYEVLFMTFSEAGLKDIAKEIEKELVELRKKKENNPES